MIRPTHKTSLFGRSNQGNKRGTWQEWQRKCIYRVSVGKPAEKIQLGRPTHIGEDNIKMCLKEMGWEKHGHNLFQDVKKQQAAVGTIMDC